MSGHFRVCGIRKTSSTEVATNETLPDTFPKILFSPSEVMSGAVQDGEFTEPAYATDEKSKPGFVRTIVAVKGLRSTNQMTMKGLKKKASNAEIESTFEQQSFCLTVEGTKGDVKHKKYQLKIRKLPGEIIPEKCYVEPDKDRVLLFLHKSEDKSWYPELENGLEMEEDQEEDS